MDASKNSEYVEAFPYPGTACPDTDPAGVAYSGVAGVEPLAWTVWGPSETEGAVFPAPFEPMAAGDGRCEAGQSGTSHDEWEARIERESRASFEAGQRQGIQEGRAAEQQLQSARRTAAEKECGSTLAHALAGFEEEKARFMANAEREVVRLALAVAARILRHEATVDPLILTGPVRVALGQLQAASEVRLRIPTCDLDLWTETIEHLPGLVTRPRIVGDDAMQTGDCVIEAELGSADLSIRAQLAEIERMVLTDGDGGGA